MSPHALTTVNAAGIAPSLDCRETISAPQPGFIGRRYSGLVIIGTNPGIPNKGPSVWRDPVYIQHIREFARQRDYGLFIEYLDYMADYMATWGACLTNAKFRQILGYDIETIAYINIVKCRSLNVGSDPFRTVGREVTRRCFLNHTARQLELLKPRWLVGQWKAVPVTLRELGYDLPGHVPCYSGQRNLTIEERLQHIVPFFRMLQAETRNA